MIPLLFMFNLCTIPIICSTMMRFGSNIFPVLKSFKICLISINIMYPLIRHQFHSVLFGLTIIIYRFINPYVGFL